MGKCAYSKGSWCCIYNSLSEGMNIDYQLNYRSATTTYIGAIRSISMPQLESMATLRVRSVVIGSAI